MVPGCTHVFISYNFSDVILFDTTYSGASRLGPVARKRTTPTQSAIFSIFLLFPPTRPLSRHRYPQCCHLLSLLAGQALKRVCTEVVLFLVFFFASSISCVRDMGINLAGLSFVIRRIFVKLSGNICPRCPTFRD